jgi:hypothetical protein
VSLDGLNKGGQSTEGYEELPTVLRRLDHARGFEVMSESRLGLFTNKHRMIGFLSTVLHRIRSVTGLHARDGSSEIRFVKSFDAIGNSAVSRNRITAMALRPSDSFLGFRP